MRVRSAVWTSERVVYVSGVRELPALEVVLEAGLEVGDEASAEEMLREMHDAGRGRH